MARHRINENGHMIWFDSDAEYNEYLKSKKGIGCMGFTVIGIIVFLLALLGTCVGDEKQPDEKEPAQTSTVQKKEKKATNKTKKASTEPETAEVLDQPAEAQVDEQQETVLPAIGTEESAFYSADKLDELLDELEQNASNTNKYYEESTGNEPPIDIDTQ